jgi:O-antigen/teichoic acid export membrane protein
VKLLALFYVQLKNKRLSFSFNFSKSHIKEQFKYGFYVLTGGGAAVLVSRFDILMIEHYLDLKQVAYYGLAFFIGSVIKVPARSISSISSPLIAKSFEENDMSNIQNIYSKTSINLLIIGGVIFLCVMLNIDDILQILPEKFSHGKYVVLFIGSAQLVNLVAGLHGLIMLHSSYYKSIIYFNVFLFIVTFVTNVIFIPKYGINGAALATFVSILTFNSVRMLYVYKKMNFHPFSIKTAIAVLMIAGIYFLISILPFTSASIISSLINIIIRCIIACSVVIVVVQYFKLSEDITLIVNKNIQKLTRR